MTSAPLDFDRVEVRDVSRHFGRRRALARVTLDLTAGTLTGLLGPNGAGKSTLLNILSTLMRPTGGQVTYGGQTATAGGEALRRRIGVLGHDLFLYSDLTALENLEFFGRLYGLPDATARAQAALVSARLSDRAHDRVSGFSRGMRQRLALERAILHGPRLVLLDEPFTGLDDASSVALSDRLRAVRDAGAIVVMATHDFDSAEGVVSDVWKVADGRATRLGGAGPLRERYRAAMAESARA
jgi:heme exporter protein A